MNLGGIILGAFKVATGIYKLLKPAPGAPTPAFAEIWPDVTANVMKAVNAAVTYGGIDTKEKLDAYLATADAALGDEPAAIDIVKGLPADKEEQLSDHLIEAARIYGYHLIGVEGYKE